MHDFLDRCDRAADETWAELKRGDFWRHVREHGFDRELYGGLMGELYHTTRHNAQNQALAATRAGSDRLRLLRFCLHHAYEEAGHDLMVLNDLASADIDPEPIRCGQPLPETQAFIAYLYRVASTCDPTARLGYSYWAESCYAHIGEILRAMRSDLGLADRQMTFFVAHAELDRGHFDEVRQIARECCDTAERQAGMIEVLRTSLRLQGSVLAGVHRVHGAQRQLA